MTYCNVKTTPQIILFSMFFVLFTIASTARADLVDVPDVEVGIVIGGSLQNGQPAEDHPLAGLWYMGGLYKTWVDHIATLTDKKYHWLNYGNAGAVSSTGSAQIEKAIAQTTWALNGAPPTSHIKTLVLSFWGNVFLWGPFNQAAVDTMISDMNDQITTAKANGIEKIVMMGMPHYKDMDLDRFLQVFPLPGHIDEAGYNEVRRQYYEAFAAAPNPDFLFVDAWCSYETLDGLHANYKSASKAAQKVFVALGVYDELIGHRNLASCTPQ